MIANLGLSEDLWRVGMSFLAAEENKRMKATLGHQAYKVNAAARDSAKNIDLQITAFIEEQGQVDTVQIARAFGFSPKQVNARLGNLLTRNIVANPGRRAVKMNTTSVSCRIWEVADGYASWRDQAEKVEEAA